jgi:ankyrin repeat protein
MNGRTPLIFASQFGNIALVNMILSYCATVISDNGNDEKDITKMLSLTSLSSSHSTQLSGSGLVSGSGLTSGLGSGSGLMSGLIPESPPTGTHVPSTSSPTKTEKCLNKMDKNHEFLMKMKNISSVQSTDEFELTALHLAAYKGYSNIVLSLLNSSSGDNALFSSKNNLNRGCQLAQIKNSQGSLPMHSVMNGNDPFNQVNIIIIIVYKCTYV